MTTVIIVFKARDGRWTYCPSAARHVPAFNFEGEFDTDHEALAAAKRDPTCAGFKVRVEGYE